MAVPVGFDPRIKPVKLMPRIFVALTGFIILSAAYRLTEGVWPGQNGVIGSRAEAAIPDDDPLAPGRVPGPDFGLKAVRGEVGTSVYASISRAGVPPMVALEAIRLLGAQFDLTRDLRASDQFSMVYTRDGNDGSGPGLTGEILMISMQSRAGRFRLYKIDGRSGPVFVDDQGRSEMPWFLRTPVDGARISSSFGARLHPILGYRRDHKGIDFAADQGTPVLAAADGVVLDARTAGGYGQRLRLTHPDGMETTYAHLSSFAFGVSGGVPVKRGQIIGYVGQTGLATGPHLHFEVRENGIAIDPRSVPGQRGPTLDTREMAQLMNRKDMLGSFMKNLEVRPTLARLDDIGPLSGASNPGAVDEIPAGTAGLRPLIGR